MNSSGIVYYYEWNRKSDSKKSKSEIRAPKSGIRFLGIGLLALSLGGLTAPFVPRLRLEAKYALLQTQKKLNLQGETLEPRKIESAVFHPLTQPDGSVIDPVNEEFSLIIPKIGINAAVIPSVNPTKPGEYMKALEKGVAHSSLSYFPDEDGTVYLFSHSTNYDWFVSDLNAVFYLLKNLQEGDLAVVYYKGSPYTYKITGKKVVNPTEIKYLVPEAGSRRLILQTCWPPGSVSERLLIFADLVTEANLTI